MDILLFMSCPLYSQAQRVETQSVGSSVRSGQGKESGGSYEGWPPDSGVEGLSLCKVVVVDEPISLVPCVWTRRRTIVRLFEE